MTFAENEDSRVDREPSEGGGPVGQSEDTLQRQDTRGRKKLNLKRESVNELVTTEHEYVHDLESLMQVVRIGQSKKAAASVDLNILMGNIDQVRFDSR